MYRRLWAGLVLIFGVESGVLSQDKDAEAEKKAYTLLITPRLHSTGYFPYSGSYLNNHVNADINIFYERKSWGAFLFKTYDIQDPHSILNYFQPGVFKRFSINEKLRFSPFAGYLFSQTNGFKDNYSDYWAALVTDYSLNDHIKFENTTLFLDPGTTTTLNNRFLTNFLLREFKFDLFVFYRHEFGKSINTVSTSLAINFPLVKFSDRVSFRTTFAVQTYVTKERPDYAQKDGFLFSLTFPVNVSQ